MTLSQLLVIAKTYPTANDVCLSGNFKVRNVLMNTQDIQSDIIRQNISLSVNTIQELLNATLNITEVVFEIMIWTFEHLLHSSCYGPDLQAFSLQSFFILAGKYININTTYSRIVIQCV